MFKRAYGFVKKFVTTPVVTMSAVAVTTSAVLVSEVVCAGVDFTDVTISTADIFTFAGIILAAIGAIWGIKKLIGMGNKS
jgi:hypothetical protein